MFGKLMFSFEKSCFPQIFYGVIEGTGGGDSLTGTSGSDTILGNKGEDTILAGAGVDFVHGGDDDDTIQLGEGNDVASGGGGNDSIDGQQGDDVIHGDFSDANLLAGITDGLNTFEQLAGTGAWTITDDGGNATISQSANTVVGEDYTIRFDLAANLAGGQSAAKVEVIWNGQVVDTVSVESGIYQTFEVSVTSEGDTGDLSFRALPPDDAPQYNFDNGPIVSYDKVMTFDGEEVTVQAFAPGQSLLYQYIGDSLQVFDVESGQYEDAVDSSDFRVNAIGFNVETDLLYGVARAAGTDALGNNVADTDIVAIDAQGLAYRVGEGPGFTDFVGDFDDAGNLWSFSGSLDRVSKIDVDQLDANGDPVSTEYDLPDDALSGNVYDIAFSTADNAFYAVQSPSSNGGNGKVIRIEMSDVEDGGNLSIETIDITSTRFGSEVEDGMPKGAYGAVFLDADDNLYFGLNSGDHDLDGDTNNTGALYKVHVDWDAGTAYSEFMSTADTTSQNDGAVDPRSSDAFQEIDADAAVLLRNPELVNDGEGGNDTITGGEGNDTLFGDEGQDSLSGGDDDDSLDGGTGDDTLQGDAGDDTLVGGAGQDLLTGGAGDDVFIEVAGDGADTISDFNTGNSGLLNDGDQSNNDFVDLSNFYNENTLNAVNGSDGDASNDFDHAMQMLKADHADGRIDGVIDGKDYSEHIGDVDLTLLSDGTNAVLADDLTYDNTNVVCFTPATKIITRKGERPVEALKVGDEVMTLDHGYQPIRWIGSRTISADIQRSEPRLRPICLKARSLSAQLPYEDTYVSPQHRFLIRSKVADRMFGESEILVSAKKLLSHDGVYVKDGIEDVTYLHIMFDQHEIIFANGAPAESLYLGAQAIQSMDQAAIEEIALIFPQVLDEDYQPIPARFIENRGRKIETLLKRHEANGKSLSAM